MRLDLAGSTGSVLVAMEVPDLCDAVLSLRLALDRAVRWQRRCGPNAAAEVARALKCAEQAADRLETIASEAGCPTAAG